MMLKNSSAGFGMRRNPHDGRYFGVRVGRDGRADPEDLAHAADRLVMVRTLLENVPRVP
jgi:hypothetical protein